VSAPFILEACPPKASLRDLGSLNGTQSMARNAADASPTNPRSRAQNANTPLWNGDPVEVGQATVSIAIAKPVGQPAVIVGIQPGELSELSPENLFTLVFETTARQFITSLVGNLAAPTAKHLIAMPKISC